MIAVIADDFTGAAEIGGIGLRRGLKTVIETDLVEPEDAGLLIIATDTRSDSVENAVIKTEKVTRHLLKLNPSFIYKKLDSVLRGNVADELLAQMRVSGKNKAIVVAGNPYLGRTIKDGVYYINGIPVADTYFAQDPEFPVTSSRISEIIGAHRSDIFPISLKMPLPDSGLIFGDVIDQKDMGKWAGKMDEDTIPAGGAVFFDTLLNRQIPVKQEHVKVKCALGKRILFVFGSAYPKDQKQTRLLKKKGFVFMKVPKPLYKYKKQNQELIDGWSDDICRQVAGYGKVIIHVGQESEFNVVFSPRIRESMGKVVRKVVEKTAVDDLLIEGGATTSVVLKYLGISKLYPFRELESGVIQMKTDRYPGMSITTKPGSYIWPDCLIINDEKRINMEQSLTNPS